MAYMRALTVPYHHIKLRVPIYILKSITLLLHSALSASLTVSTDSQLLSLIVLIFAYAV